MDRSEVQDNIYNALINLEDNKNFEVFTEWLKFQREDKQLHLEASCESHQLAKISGSSRELKIIIDFIAEARANKDKKKKRN